jgi:ATP-binding cassette subfamily F protein 3
VRYPGTYEEFRWSKSQRETGGQTANRSMSSPQTDRPISKKSPPQGERPKAATDRNERRQQGQVERRQKRDLATRQKRINALEQRVADCEQEIKKTETLMATPGFYDDREAARPVVDRHQKLMWEVGELMIRWEALQDINDAKID